MNTKTLIYTILLITLFLITASVGLFMYTDIENRTVNVPCYDRQYNQIQSLTCTENQIIYPEPEIYIVEILGAIFFGCLITLPIVIPELEDDDDDDDEDEEDGGKHGR